MDSELVRSADDMDDDTFALHMGHRHADSMGGLTILRLRASAPGLTLAWRKFHDRLHEVRHDLTHEHEREPAQNGPKAAYRRSA